MLLIANMAIKISISITGYAENATGIPGLDYTFTVGKKEQGLVHNN